MAKYVVMYSGGAFSWMTAQRVVEKKHGNENVYCLFTDTLIEDQTLYTFLLETTQLLFEIDQADLIEESKQLPLVSHRTMRERKHALKELAQRTNDRNPHVHWLMDGRDPWDVFKEKRWLGNSRVAQCSHVLKQDIAQAFVRKNYRKKDTTLYFGIGWEEKHRIEKVMTAWSPYKTKFPMCDPPYLDNGDVVKLLKKQGIAVPKLYLEEFTHNNCGGFCVRAGQKHFIKLLETNPELYRYHEEREQEIIADFNKDVSILKEVNQGKTLNLTLKGLREKYERKKEIDQFDIGGCGCFVE